MAEADGSRRGDAVDEDVIEAVGTLSEAYEYLIRARGHLYTFHQLMGRVDFLFGDAADQLRAAGEASSADRLCEEIVGRNVLDGRWTFQVVEEFDGLYWEPAHEAVRALERRFQNGRRHVYESRLKEQRRSAGRAGHERRPAGAQADEVDTDESISGERRHLADHADDWGAGVGEVAQDRTSEGNPHEHQR